MMELIMCSPSIQRTAKYPKGDIRNYSDLVIQKTWQEEEYRTGNRINKVNETHGEIWTNAIQKAIEENEYIYIPPFKDKIYIDRPLIIPSNRTIEVSEYTTISLIPNSNCCMLRNEMSKVDHGIFDFKTNPNKNIKIIGGIWSYGNNGICGGNGNFSAHFTPGMKESDNGPTGAFSFSNIKNIEIRNIHFIDISSFAIQISGAENFTVDTIYFENSFRDGVHINGPAKKGLIKNIFGKTGDDIIALNAWDWSTCSMSIGTIEDVIVDRVETEPNYLWSEIRLLSAILDIKDKGTLECSLKNCTLKNIKGIHTIKGYNQPKQDSPLKIDHPDIGKIENLSFENIKFNYINPENYYTTKYSGFEFCSDCNNITFKNIFFDFPLGKEDYGNWSVATIGPMTASFLEPNSYCKASNFKFQNIFHTLNKELKNLTDENLFIRTKKIIKEEKEIGSGEIKNITIN